METEREPKIGWKTLPITDPLIAADLEETRRGLGSVMISRKCRYGRHHLKLHRNRAGVPFVRVGVRGSGKMELEFCEVTYLDGVPTLFAYVFKKSEAELRWEANDRRRLGLED
jgi:hypothetical protein